MIADDRFAFVVVVVAAWFWLYWKWWPWWRRRIGAARMKHSLVGAGPSTKKTKQQQQQQNWTRGPSGRTGNKPRWAVNGVVVADRDEEEEEEDAQFRA